MHDARWYRFDRVLLRTSSRACVLVVSGALIHRMQSKTRPDTRIRSTSLTHPQGTYPHAQGSGEGEWETCTRLKMLLVQVKPVLERALLVNFFASFGFELEITAADFQGSFTFGVKR
jgi:hypothetical protein